MRPSSVQPSRRPAQKGGAIFLEAHLPPLPADDLYSVAGLILYWQGRWCKEAPLCAPLPAATALYVRPSRVRAARSGTTTTRGSTALRRTPERGVAPSMSEAPDVSIWGLGCDKFPLSRGGGVTRDDIKPPLTALSTFVRRGSSRAMRLSNVSRLPRE